MGLCSSGLIYIDFKQTDVSAISPFYNCTLSDLAFDMFEARLKVNHALIQTSVHLV